MEKKYWKGVEELRNDAEFVRLKNNEFYEHLPLDEVIGKKAEVETATPRRDFLKFLGFSVAAASLAACEAPVRKTIPYLIKPEDITPGIANYYASSYFDGHDYCSILVKTREGRPIKIEGNPKSSVTHGKVNARVQASVLSLYDNARLQHPLANGSQASWETLDKNITSKLADISAKGGKIRILTSTIISPSTKKIMADFMAKYPGTSVVTYDAVSQSGLRQAHKDSFGLDAVPTYHFENADVVAGIGADFLANWISPVEHAYQYAQNRKLESKNTMSRHFQFEAALSVTGSNADVRSLVRPSQYGAVVANLYNAVAAKLGGAPMSAPSLTDGKNELEKCAIELVAAKGKALVVCGVNDAAIQNIVVAINNMLGSYGSTINTGKTCNLRQGNDADVATLISDMSSGSIGALIIHNCNPVYSLPNGAQFGDALKKVECSVALSDREDETASLCKFVATNSHPLESWGDAEPCSGSYSLQQPAIAPLFSTRQMQESLLAWMGTPMNYHDYIQQYWQSNMFSAQTAYLSFTSFWNETLQNGVFEKGGDNNLPSYTGTSSVAVSLTDVKSGGMELVIYEKTGIGNGSQSNNPWLQEMPDPISKVTWDNYLAVSPKDAREKGWKQNNVVTLKANGISMEVPVYVQPGQAPGTVSLALGYGRTKAGSVANNIGSNAYAFTSMNGNSIAFYAANVSVEKSVKDDYRLAATQLHHTMMGRAIVKETTLKDFQNHKGAGNEKELFEVKVGSKVEHKPADEVNLWDDHETGFHHWGLGIDLNSCTGCGACVVACQAENNVAVVGKDEVMRSREMHWMRIDRYYSSIAEPKSYGDMDDLPGMETPEDNPTVVFQPIMCQHCNHAPCETVCPVIATSHSREGLNQMTYNRCVGTRYCANNCPYKVRRFNWFKYSDNNQFNYNMNNDLGKMVLNPDVTVRSRGVMEKCSMCVQRIQETKLKAKKDKRKIQDGEFTVACAQTCPTNAITFGDYKNSDSNIAKIWKPEERSYHLLEELNIQPNVFYQTKVRNVEVSRLAKVEHGGGHEEHKGAEKHEEAHGASH